MAIAIAARWPFKRCYSCFHKSECMDHLQEPKKWRLWRGGL